MSEKGVPIEIRVGDRVNSHLGDSVVVNIEPPTVAKVIEHEDSEALHPIASTIMEGDSVELSGESWPPEKVGEALIKGHDAVDMPLETPEDRKEVHEQISNNYAKGSRTLPESTP